MGATFEQRNNVLYGRHNLDGEGHDRELAGLNSREIENVVDDPTQ